MSKQVMQRALDALTGVLDDDKDVRKASITGGLYEVVDCRQAIAELRAEIAKPVEPVAFVSRSPNHVSVSWIGKTEWPNLTKLYTTPPDAEAMRKELDDGLKDRVALAMELERVKGERDAMAQALAHIASFDPWEPSGPATHCAKYALSGIAAQGGGE